MDDVKAVIEHATDAALGTPTEAPVEVPKPEIGTPPEAPQPEMDNQPEASAEAPKPEMGTPPEEPAEAPKAEMKKVRRAAKKVARKVKVGPKKKVVKKAKKSVLRMPRVALAGRRAGGRSARKNRCRKLLSGAGLFRADFQWLRGAGFASASGTSSMHASAPQHRQHETAEGLIGLLTRHTSLDGVRQPFAVHRGQELSQLARQLDQLGGCAWHSHFGAGKFGRDRRVKDFDLVGWLHGRKG